MRENFSQQEEPTKQENRAERGFFGRRHGKKLRPNQQDLLQTLLPHLRLDLSKPPLEDLRQLFAMPVEDIRLEIGFGGGEHLLHHMQLLPQTGFIGVEPFVNGMAKLLDKKCGKNKELERLTEPSEVKIALEHFQQKWVPVLRGKMRENKELERLTPPSEVKTALEADTTPAHNLRLYDDDAVSLLDWLPASSLAGVDLFYPDPWPKKRHWKRRFVNEANLDRIARVLRVGGVFRFASDIDSYVDWTLTHCHAHPAFANMSDNPDDWRIPYPDWPSTRYEQKALREGRHPTYLTFHRL